MREQTTMSLSVMAAMLLGMTMLVPLTADREFLVWGAVVVVLLQVASALGGEFRLPRALVHAIQMTVLLAAMVLVTADALPQADSWLDSLSQGLAGSLDHIRTQAAPMEPHPGVRALLVALIGMVCYLADVLAVTLASPSWTVAALLTFYLIPALVLRVNAAWWSLLALGTGYLVILMADQIGHDRAWTRNLSGDSAGSSARLGGGAARMGVLIGVPAMALAVVLGVALPNLGTWQMSSGRSRGSGPIQLQDPSIDLRDNLNQPVDRTVITYQSDAPGGVYLRMASLPVLSESGFALSSVELQGGNLPAVPGLGNAPAVIRTRVQIGALDSEYLPVPYAPRSLNAPGEWRHDPVSLTIIATGENRATATRYLSYEVASTAQGPDPQLLSRSPAGTPAEGEMVTEVPPDTPQAIIDLSHEWTAGQPTPALKAAAIQARLQDQRVFRYDTTAPPGTGFEVLTNFLTTTHSGYCVHYASAMALMARIEGIPSRVAIGFLPGKKVGDSWEVGIHSYHAWPELYFRDVGWVRFEPTVTMSPPGWTLVAPPDTSASPTPSASGSPDSEPTPTVSTSPSFDPGTNPDTGQGGSTLPWRTIAAWALAILLSGGILAGPGVARLAIRRSRLSPARDPGTLVKGAWTEVRDSVLDLDRTWPTGSPRRIAATLGTGLDQSAREALERLALLEERARYARELGEPGDIAGDVATIRSGLSAGLPRSTTVRAVALPASLWRSQRR